MVVKELKPLVGTQGALKGDLHASQFSRRSSPGTADDVVETLALAELLLHRLNELGPGIFVGHIDTFDDADSKLLFDSHVKKQTSKKRFIVPYMVRKKQQKIEVL